MAETKGVSAIGQSNRIGEIKEELHSLAQHSLTTIIENNPPRNLLITRQVNRRETGTAGRVIAKIAEVEFVVGPKEIGLRLEGVELRQIRALERPRRRGLRGGVSHTHTCWRRKRGVVFL